MRKHEERYSEKIGNLIQSSSTQYLQNEGFLPPFVKKLHPNDFEHCQTLHKLRGPPNKPQPWEKIHRGILVIYKGISPKFNHYNLA